jgi:hypothetical protein
MHLLERMEWKMKREWIPILMLAYLFAVPTKAQDRAPLIEVSPNYSYMRFGASGLEGIPPRNINGGGASININLFRSLGIKAEAMGYESTLWRTTFRTPVGTSQATIPPGDYDAQGNMFTYVFGPTYTHRTETTNVFGQILFGGSKTNGYAEWAKSIDGGGGVVAAIAPQRAFTMILGGGLDINVTKQFALRLLELDYVRTDYNNALTFATRQNNFRFVTGFVFRIGER